jgi:hypothetical protein
MRHFGGMASNPDTRVALLTSMVTGVGWIGLPAAS